MKAQDVVPTSKKDVIPPENPIPCPFCGAKPDFQTAIDSQRGSWFEWECSGCYFVSISLQLDHHFMDEIGISDDGYDPKTLRFNTGTYVAILNYVVGLWNDRTDRVGGES